MPKRSYTGAEYQRVQANLARGRQEHRTRTICMNADQIRKDAHEVLALAQKHNQPVVIESGPAAGVTVHPDGRGIVAYIFAHEEALCA